jgi:hypothetical protein
VLHNQPAADGGTTDKWILFGMLTPEDNQTLKNQNVSMFALHKDPSGHQTTYMMDFDRKPNPQSGSIDITPIVLRNVDPPNPAIPSKNCHDCHKLAILPIYPDIEYKFDASGKLVPKSSGDPLGSPMLNGVIRRYTAPDFPMMDMAAYGPPAGPTDRLRSDDFLRSCANDQTLTNASLATIRDNMGCAECHNDAGNGSLNYLQAARSKRDDTAFRDKRSMLTTFVEQGWMPTDATVAMTAQEEKALAVCVSKEYFDPASKTGVFVEWLKPKLGP